MEKERRRREASESIYADFKNKQCNSINKLLNGGLAINLDANDLTFSTDIGTANNDIWPTSSVCL